MALVSSTVQGNASERQKQTILQHFTALTRGYGSHTATNITLVEANIFTDSASRGRCKAEMMYDVEVDEGTFHLLLL
jgi:hypothetical protein